MTGKRVPYRATRTCCDGPEGYQSDTLERTLPAESLAPGITAVWVECQACGERHEAERGT